MGLGYEVRRSRDLLGEGAADAAIHELACDRDWLLVTQNERDFQRLRAKRRGRALVLPHQDLNEAASALDFYREFVLLAFSGTQKAWVHLRRMAVVISKDAER